MYKYLQATVTMIMTSLSGSSRGDVLSQVPPAMTPTQKMAFNRLSKVAEEASQYALDTTLGRLSDQQFIEQLTTLLGGTTGVAQLGLNLSNASAIWERYQAELEVSEVIHAFPAKYDPHQNNGMDLDIRLARNSSWFMNQWEIAVLYPAREAAARGQVIMFLGPSAATEIDLWHLEPFTGSIPRNIGPPDTWPGGYPADLSEASNRAVYGMLNQQKLDFPGFLWGDVVTVFNNSAIANMTILQPMDTGDFTADCNFNFTRSACAAFNNDIPDCKSMWFCNETINGSCFPVESKPAKNCSSWQYHHAVGTFSHNAHLIPAYSDFETLPFWRDRLAGLFARMLPLESTPLGDITPMSVTFFDFYYEANLLGNPSFKDDHIKFVMASMQTLFGNDDSGSEVRQWCIDNGWALIWSPGPNLPAQAKNPPYQWKADKRIFDPIVLANSSASWNISSSRLKDASDAFESVWKTAHEARCNQSINLQNATIQWWQDLVTGGVGQQVGWLTTRPLSSDSCASPNTCIGTARSGSNSEERHCVCYKQ